MTIAHRQPRVSNVTDAIQLLSFDEDSCYQDPAGFFARLRESRPVAPVRMPNYGRAWIITRYEDVRAALTDPRLAKDIRRWPGGGRSRPTEVANVHAYMLNSDPPDHTRLRRLVQKAFTPRRAAQLRPRTEEVAAGLLDKMAARGDVIDLLDGYARPIPITVLSELLGIPAADREWIRVTMSGYDKGGEEFQRVPRELAAYFTGLIAAKRAEPGNDLLSALVLARDNAGEEGAEDGLNSTELLSAAFLLPCSPISMTSASAAPRGRSASTSAAARFLPSYPARSPGPPASTCWTTTASSDASPASSASSTTPSPDSPRRPAPAGRRSCPPTATRSSPITTWRPGTS